MDGSHKKGLNSLIILGAWTIWNHRNRCVFDGTPPSLAGALLLASEEQRFWKLAKAQGSSFPSLEPVDSQYDPFVEVKSFPILVKGACVCLRA